MRKMMQFKQVATFPGSLFLFVKIDHLQNVANAKFYPSHITLEFFQQL